MTDPTVVFTHEDPRVVEAHIRQDHGFCGFSSLADASADGNFRMLWATNTKIRPILDQILKTFSENTIAHEFHHSAENVKQYRRLGFGCTPEKVILKLFLL